MIEMVYNGKESHGQDEVRLPKNIRQIGDNSSKKKVYVEDYVMTQLKKNPKNEESVRYGVLLGDAKKVKGYSYIFVKGMVEVEEVIENSLIFNDEIWTKLYKDIKRYFDNFEIVGWFVSVPYRVKDDMSGIKKIHLDNFAGNDKVCFLSDRTEKEDGFYIYESGALSRQSGYYIYYEKNEKMKRYLKEKSSMKYQSEQIDKEKKTETNGEDIKELELKEAQNSRMNHEEEKKEKTKEQQMKKKEKNEPIIGEGKEKDDFDLRKEIGKRKNGMANQSVVLNREKENRLSKVALGVSGLLIIALLLSTIVMLNNYGELKNIKSSLENMNDEQNAQAVNQIINSLTTSDGLTSDKKNEKQSVNENLAESNAQNVETQKVEAQENTTTQSEPKEETSQESVAQEEENKEQKQEANAPVGIYGGAVHTVALGQTLYDISMTYYGNSDMVEKIKAFNEIGDDYKIIEGQQIKLP